MDEETFNEFLYFLELFTTVFCVSNYFFRVSNYFTIVFCVAITMYKLKENYTVGTKGLCSTDFFNEVSLIFIHMVSTGEFLLQLLQTKVASIYWISSVFDA